MSNETNSIASKTRKPKRWLSVGDGCYLKYCFPYEKAEFDNSIGKERFVRTRIDPRIQVCFEEAKDRGDKKYLPLVDGRRVSYGPKKLETYYNIIFLDIDKLPPGFNSFEEVNKSLKTYLSSVAVDVGSFSQRLKWAIRVKTKRTITKNQALRVIFNLLPKKFHPFIDDQGLFRSFVSGKVFVNQIQSLKKLKAIEAPEWTKEDKKITKYFISKKKLPNKLKELCKTSKEIKFYKMLLVMSNLNMPEGFGISTEVIAVQLKVERTTVSSWLKKAERLQVLKCIDRTYRPHIRPRRYKARELLSKFIKKEKQTEPSGFLFPQVIEDGNWHSVILKTVIAFKGPLEDLLESFEKIPGFDCKDRKKQVIELYRWFKSRKSLVESSKFS